MSGMNSFRSILGEPSNLRQPQCSMWCARMVVFISDNECQWKLSRRRINLAEIRINVSVGRSTSSEQEFANVRPNERREMIIKQYWKCGSLSRPGLRTQQCANAVRAYRPSERECLESLTRRSCAINKLLSRASDSGYQTDEFIKHSNRSPSRFICFVAECGTSIGSFLPLLPP